MEDKLPVYTVLSLRGQYYTLINCISELIFQPSELLIDEVRVKPPNKIPCVSGLNSAQWERTFSMEAANPGTLFLLSDLIFGITNASLITGEHKDSVRWIGNCTKTNLPTGVDMAF